MNKVSGDICVFVLGAFRESMIGRFILDMGRSLGAACAASYLRKVIVPDIQRLRITIINSALLRGIALFVVKVYSYLFQSLRASLSRKLILKTTDSADYFSDPGTLGIVIAVSAFTCAALALGFQVKYRVFLCGICGMIFLLALLIPRHMSEWGEAIKRSVILRAAGYLAGL
ncbi:MAG: hypothetical protein ABH806_02555 [Candidatus Omnitrophota bacterium]